MRFMNVFVLLYVAYTRLLLFCLREFIIVGICILFSCISTLFNSFNALFCKFECFYLIECEQSCLGPGLVFRFVSVEQVTPSVLSGALRASNLQSH